MAEINPIASAKEEFLCEKLSFAAKEAYKRLRTNVLFSFADGDVSHVVGMTSSHPSDGKSLTAINLGFSMFELGKKVLLIDADMRRPSIDKKLELSQIPGLSDLLVNTNDIASGIRRFRKGEDGSIFDIMPAGNIPPNPSELLNSARMQRLLEKLKAAYDFIIVDLPPVGAVTDAQTVSKLTDGMLIVVREDFCDGDVLDDCIAQLRLANAKILGFILNGAKEGAKKSYGKYSSKYSYYK